eukprot:534130-Pelagomonas_calceolata.AAC.1
MHASRALAVGFRSLSPSSSGVQQRAAAAAAWAGLVARSVRGMLVEWCRQRQRGARHRAEAWMTSGEWRVVPVVWGPGKAWHFMLSCWAWVSLVGRLTLLVVKGLELQSYSYHPALFLVAAPVFFLCLPYFSQSALRGGVDSEMISIRRVISLKFKLPWYDTTVLSSHLSQRCALLTHTTQASFYAARNAGKRSKKDVFLIQKICSKKKEKKTYIGSEHSLHQLRKGTTLVHRPYDHPTTKFRLRLQQYINCNFQSLHDDLCNDRRHSFHAWILVAAVRLFLRIRMKV